MRPPLAQDPYRIDAFDALSVAALLAFLAVLAAIFPTPPPSPRGAGHTPGSIGLSQVDGTAGQSSGRGTLVVASWYGAPYHGRRTASGEIFDKEALTYAHRTDPFGTRRRFWVAGYSVVAVCSDRGPFHKDRDIDLSEGAARRLGMIRAGVAILNSEVLP